MELIKSIIDDVILVSKMPNDVLLSVSFMLLVAQKLTSEAVFEIPFAVFEDSDMISEVSLTISKVSYAISEMHFYVSEVSDTISEVPFMASGVLDATFETSKMEDIASDFQIQQIAA